MMKSTFTAFVLGASCLVCGPALANPPQGDATSAGKQVFDRWCAACHGRGDRYPGTASLAVKYGADKPAALEDRTDLTPELVHAFVRHGVMIMPPFRKTEITDAELDALGKYLSRPRDK